MRPTRSKSALAFALALCWLLSGCSQWLYDLGENLDQVILPAPEDGTTLGEALALLGPPHRMSASSSGYVLAWEHWNIKETSLGFSLGAMGADFMSMDYGEMRAAGEFILLTFDRQHRLTSASRSEWDTQRGRGQAIQPLFGFVSVVDAGDLVRRMPQHRWGAASLRRLPEALNLESNLYTGQSGLEQRGTPGGIGQHSLELD